MLVKSELSKKYNEFAKIFEYKEFNDSLINYLKRIEVPTNQVCAKEMKNEGHWKCLDCQMRPNCIICNECYQKGKEKHNGHKIQYQSNTNGCCDCGNPEYWKPMGFCSEHKGPFTNDEEINTYIQKCFKPNILKKISNKIIEIFNLVNDYIIKSELKVEVSYFNEVMNSLLEFIFKIINSNIGLLHLISEMLSRNFPVKTTHECIHINIVNKEVEFRNFGNKEHICVCPFLKNLFNVWSSELRWEKLFYPFLQNFKMKLLIGIIWECFFPSIMKNKAQDIISFAFQVSSDSLSEIISQHEEIILRQFSDLELQAQNLVSNGPIEDFYNYIVAFRNYLSYLLRATSFSNISNMSSVYKKLININCILTNYDSMKLVSSFKREEFNSKVYESQYFFQDIDSLMITIFNFNNKELKSEILEYLIDKIINKKFKVLDKNKNSYYIHLFRLLSMFLVHYTFNKCSNKKRDFVQANEKIMKSLPHLQKLTQIVLSELFKQIGFILSIKQKYWVHYGEMQEKYYNLYFIVINNYLDFALIKMFLLLPENKEYFTLSKILEMAAVNDSNILFQKNILSKKEFTKKSIEEIVKENEENTAGLNGKIFDIITKILRNDNIFLSIYFFSYKKLDEGGNKLEKMKKLIMKEKENLIKILKQNIIIKILLNGNISSFYDIIKFLPSYLKEIFQEEEIEKILTELCDRIIGRNQEVLFQIKNQFLNEYDSDIVLIPIEAEQKQIYLMKIIKEEVNLLNTVPLQTISLLESFSSKCSFNFFSIEENINFYTQFTKSLVLNNIFKSLVSIFLFPSLKTIAYFVFLIKTSTLFKEFKTSHFEKLIDLFFYLNANVLTWDLGRSLCNYLEKSLSELLQIKCLNEGDSDKVLKRKSNNLMNKLKKKFQVQNEKIQKQFIFFLNKPETNNEITCVICHGLFDDSISLYGKLCSFTNDNLFLTAKLRAIKDYFNSNKTKISFEQYYNDVCKFPYIAQNYKMRYISCGHMIHSSCYQDMLQESNNKSFFPCPLCKTLCQIYLPNFSSFKVEVNKELLKGTKMCDIFVQEENTLMIELKDMNGFFVSEFDQQLMQQTKRFIEGYFEHKFNTKLLLDMYNENEANIIYKILINEFEALIDFIVNNENNAIKIELYIDAFLALRALIKVKWINPNIFLRQFRFFLENLMNGLYENISELLNSCSFDKFYAGLMFLMLIFLDADDIKANAKYIIKLVLPYILVEIYIRELYISNQCELNLNTLMKRMKMDDIEKYFSFSIKDKSNIIILILIKVFKKFDICLAIANNNKISSPFCDNLYDYFHKYDIYTGNKEVLSDILLQLEMEFPFSNLKKEYPVAIGEIIEHYLSKKDIISNNKLINPWLLLLGLESKFRFINLPQDMLTFFFKYQNKPCSQCGESSPEAFICLCCGMKFCLNPEKCVQKCRDVEFPSCIFHCIQTGGNCAFIFLENGEINFFSYLSDSDLNYFAYLNKFGDYPKESTVSKDYVLNQENMHKALEIYMSLSFRKYKELGNYMKSFNEEEIPNLPDHNKVEDEIV